MDLVDVLAVLECVFHIDAILDKIDVAVHQSHPGDIKMYS